MPVILDKLKLSYTPVPKVACTSLKTMLFEVENGRDFVPFQRNGQEFHIHNVYQSTVFDPRLKERLATYRRLLLVRDPIQRFLSAYSNRVVHHRELSSEKSHKNLVAHDLAPNPNLQEFVAKIRQYMITVDSIDHHTRPLVDFAGIDARFYTRIYKMHEIEVMVHDISSIVGRPLTLKRLQTGGPKLGIDELDRSAIDILREFYAEDYRVFGEYF